MALQKDDPLAVALAVIGYALSSSLLAIVNKYAVTVFPFPAALTSAQYIFCVVATFMFGKMGLVEHDRLTWDKSISFLPAAVTFYVAIWTNTQLLKHANVETFIVFRSCTPLLVAIADSAILKRPWPSRETFLSLFIILGGAIAYVASDSQFTLTAYTWAWAYLLCITFEMVYIKKIVMTAGLNTWGLVLYNNLLALIFVPPSLLGMNEPAEILEFGLGRVFSTHITVPVLLSCMFGLSISYFGFLCRHAVSATAYTVIGVTNKFITIIINLLIWDKHASPGGLIALLVCILAGMYYQHTVTARMKDGSEEIQPVKQSLDHEQDVEGCMEEGREDPTGSPNVCVKDLKSEA